MTKHPLLKKNWNFNKNLVNFFKKTLTNPVKVDIILKSVSIVPTYAGVVQWLEFQPSKLAVWVRFPSPAPKFAPVAQPDRASAF